MCGSKGSSTTSSTFTPPAGVQANYDYLSNQAKNVASTPFQQYAGQMVASMTPEQQAGIGQINASANLAQPYFEAATGYEQQGATPFGQQALNQYMSPYINSVANSTLANLNETNAQQQQQVLGNNITRGAFGGDRSQIAQAELARQQGLATGQTMAGIYQGGFNQAEQQFNADQARRMAAGQTLGGFGTAAQTAAMQGGQAMLGAGAQEQAYQQALDTANQQQFQAAQAYPFQTTQFLGNLLLGIGGQSGGTSLASQPGPNVGSQLLGGLMTLGSIPWGSDERLKENMEPVGKTFDGQNIYKFNYKNDGRTMLGLSAQEVEKHKPEAVHKDDQGMRSVDYETAVNGAAKRGHFADGGVPDWMGGAVHEGLGRAHYATAGSVDDIPYTSQPSGGTGTAPLTLKDLMPLAALISQGKLGGDLKFPDAPKPLEEGTMMDVAKQLQGMSSEQRANMKSNIGSIGNIINPPITVPGTAIGQSQGTYSLGLPYASGGVAARGAYKDGQTVPTPPDTMPDQAAPDQTTPSSSPLSSLGNILPSKGQSIIEKATGLDLSDNARMGMLAAGLGMLSSRSPFFGVGVGEGATAGLGAYYNAKANDRTYANKLRELQMTEEQRNIERERLGIDRSRVGVDALSSVQRIYDDLNTRYSLLAGTGALTPEGLPKEGHPQERVATELYNRLQEQRKILMQIQGTALSGRGAKIGTDDPYASLAKTVLTAPSTTPAEVKPPVVNPPAVSPVVAPDVKKSEPEPIPVSAPAPVVIPKTDTTANIYDALPQDLNPQTLLERSRAAFATGDSANGVKLRDEAERIRKEISDSGKVTTTDGKIVEVPGYNEYKESQTRLPENLKMFASYPERLMALQKSEANQELMKQVLEHFESNSLAPLTSRAQGFLRSLGFEPTGDHAEDAANFERLFKDSQTAMFSDIKEAQGGQRILATEIDKMNKAEPGGALQPEANRTLMGQKIGTTQWTRKYLMDALKERKKVGDAKFDEANFANDWVEQNKLSDFVKKAELDVAVKGATPNLNEPKRFKKGQIYIVDKDNQGRPFKVPRKGRWNGERLVDEGAVE